MASCAIGVRPLARGALARMLDVDAALAVDAVTSHATTPVKNRLISDVPWLSVT